MKITVLNGSPKGEISVTMQYVEYIRKHFPAHQISILNVSHDSKKIERNPEVFARVIDEVRSSDGILWAFPVYYVLVPSQLKRFIELVFENNADDVFKDKYTAVLTTSIHFYDTIAANYMNAICDDLEMRYTGEYLAHMNDLEVGKERTNILAFMAHFIHAIENKTIPLRNYAPIEPVMLEYTTSNVVSVPKTGGKNVVVVTDESGTDSNLSRMIDTFIKVSPDNIEVVDINDVPIKGGCLGCLRCAYDNQCAYNDGVRDLYENRLLAADAIIIAGSIKDRYLSSRIKMIFDRSFYRGHTPFFMGKLMGAIISGPLRQIPNIRLAFEVFAQSHINNSIGIITDEYDSSDEVTERIRHFASDLTWTLEKDLKKPETFLGVSSHLIFRDFIYGARGIFRADHIYYKEHGLYNYPHKNIRRRLGNIGFELMFKIKPVREQVQKDMKQHMISGLRKVVSAR